MLHHSILEVAVITVSEHSRYLFNGEGGVFHKKNSSLHSFFEKDFRDFSSDLTMQQGGDIVWMVVEMYGYIFKRIKL